MMVEFVGGPMDGESREMGANPSLTVVIEMPRIDEQARSGMFSGEDRLVAPDHLSERPTGRYGAELRGPDLVYVWKGED